MSLMDLLNDWITGPLNLIDKADWLLRGTLYQDYGHQFAIPRVDKGGKHNFLEVQRILARYGVVTFGRGHDSQNIYFHVRNRQAGWAEYLLMNAGVELRSPPVEPRNVDYAASKPPGWMPIPWSEDGWDQDPHRKPDQLSSQSVAAVSDERGEPDPPVAGGLAGLLDRLERL